MTAGIETIADAGVDTRAAGSSLREERRGPLDAHFALLLAAIAVAGLVARVVYVVVMRDRDIFTDAVGYHFRGLLLADGEGFVFPTSPFIPGAENSQDASVAPGFTALLAAAAKLGLRSVLSQQLVSCVVGGTTIVMTGLAGRAAVGSRTGLLAAGLVAVYPNVWIYERELVSEPLAMLGAATIIWLAYRFIAGPSGWLALALGATLGLFALSRAEQLMLVPLLLVPLMLTARSVPVARRVGWLSIACGACAVVIAPWTVYNATRFDLLVPISTTMGAALRQGNCPVTYSGELIGYTALPDRPETFADCGPTDEEFAHDQSRSDLQMRRAALEYMGDHPRQVPIVAAARLGRTFNVFRPFQQVHLEASRLTPIWIVRTALFSYWVLVPFAVYGFIAARRRRITVFPLVVPFVAVAITVAFTIGAVRYRAAAEVPLVLLASIGINFLLAKRSNASGNDPSPALADSLPNPVA